MDKMKEHVHGRNSLSISGTQSINNVNITNTKHVRDHLGLFSY